ncbi:MAG: FAD-binding oxidoreductase [Magnetococcales bacterium]|nr:FAD-binding oxidoreductase [Magnetococcales bacterium]
MTTSPYDALYQDLLKSLPNERLIRDTLRTLAYGTDASFYRLIPQLVVRVENEREVIALLTACRKHQTPVTFRAAGTSLSGQAISDSVLAELGWRWNGCQIDEDGKTIHLQPGVIGGDANRKLAQFGRKIGPDPASINAAKLGGIVANNASGMCCGTAQNSYQTLVNMKLILVDGTLLDTSDANSRERFYASHSMLLQRLDDLAKKTKKNKTLAHRIRHKFKIKNTTGFSLNALVDFNDPIDILQHLIIGSEGTLGFIAEVSLKTVPEHPHKATALLLFPNIISACQTVSILKEEPVSAVELIDRAGLRSVEDKPGLPSELKKLAKTVSALLVETRAANAETLDDNIHHLTQLLANADTLEPTHFYTDSETCEQLWKVRKGLFPSVGSIRKTGTTVIIEDVAFPVPQLADATTDLQNMLFDHGYTDAIIFGHALEGNLHFVFTPDFGIPEEVERYRKFMDDVAHMVVEKYDGSLKAEHGTGRNMAPFVELEWGLEAYKIMRTIKDIFDPETLLNPGVILNDNPQAHIHNLKPLPAANPLVDKCIECGFCEHTCPSRDLTLTPRQRITGWREITRLSRSQQPKDSNQEQALRELYDYQGLETCAACGLCASACPVDIETGLLTKLLRGKKLNKTQQQFGNWVGNHFGTTLQFVRLGLGAAKMAGGLIGRENLENLSLKAHHLSGNRLPLVPNTLPRPIHFKPEPLAKPSNRDKVIYFPSCASRSMGPASNDFEQVPLPEKMISLLDKAGFDVILPPDLDNLCCGQPFESKGLPKTAETMTGKLEETLRRISQEGELPILLDTSPCSYRLRQNLHNHLPVFDVTEFLHDHVLPRLSLQPVSETVALHITCNIRKMGLEEKLRALTKACINEVVEPEGITCCGFAGDRGFTTPELNATALKHLSKQLPESVKEGICTSRTYEIGLSQQSGIPYHSIVYLLDRCSKPSI